MSPTFPQLHDLEQIEFEIIRLGNVEQYRVIGALLARLYLPQTHIGIVRGLDEHLPKHVVFHKMRARTRRQIAAARQ